MAIDDTRKLASYDEIMAERISDWESDSVALVVGAIGEIGRMSKAEAEKYDAKKKTDELWMAISLALADADVGAIRDAKKAYERSLDEWHEQYKPLYEHTGVRFGDVTEEAGDLIRDYTKRTADEIANLTDTSALCVIDRNGNPIRFKEQIYNALQESVDALTGGEISFYTAMRKTVLNLGGGGARVDYGGGVTRRLDTVVRQNLLYGIKKANIEYSDRVAVMLGCDGYEIDAHTNSRPSHEFMQGKQYCIGAGRRIEGRYFIGFREQDPESEEGLSAEQALNDYGCRHYRTPIICGVSEPRFTAEQLQKIRDDNEREYTVGDKKGNGYYWTQKMRAIESEVRRSKDEVNALKAFGNSEPQIKELRQHIKTLKTKYNEIADATGINPEEKRMNVPRK